MHIYMVGFRGSGKSTVGVRLAQLLDRPYIDSDKAIEAEGRTIREIFEEVGEEGFRDKEQDVILRIGALAQPHVVGLGGGAILRETNRRGLKSSGRCVWLQGSPSELFKRISEDASSVASRPNLTAGGGYNEVVDLLAKREPLYQEVADFVAQTDGRTPDEIAEELAVWARTVEQ